MTLQFTRVSITGARLLRRRSNFMAEALIMNLVSGGWRRLTIRRLERALVFKRADEGLSMFKDGAIDGVIIKPLKRFTDNRGWLTEVFRHDEMDPLFHPTMMYVSETLPGIARGPHEHVHQADTFGFIGPSDFKLYLWDNRPGSRTFEHRTAVVVGESNPCAVTIPAGVVHAYQNIGGKSGWVFNCPNQLYRGKGKLEPVDEIRHEDRADNLYHFF